MIHNFLLNAKVRFLRMLSTLRSVAKNRPERSAQWCTWSLPPVVGSPHCLPPTSLGQRRQVSVY